MARMSMSEYQYECNLGFWTLWKARKKAREEGIQLPDNKHVKHAKRHMAHKPYGGY